jgi:hypothetical protein
VIKTLQLIKSRNFGWRKFRSSAFKQSLGHLDDCPFKQENREIGMVLFLPDPTVEEADKTNVGRQKWMY